MKVLKIMNQKFTSIFIDWKIIISLVQRDDLIDNHKLISILFLKANHILKNCSVKQICNGKHQSAMEDITFLFVIQEKTKLIMFRKMTAQIVFKSSHQRCSVKKDALKNFENFTGKHLDSLFNKVADSFIKKRLKNRCFAAKFSNF